MSDPFGESAPCKCSQPKGMWTFGEGDTYDAVPRLIRCAACEAVYAAACEEFSAALFAGLGGRMPKVIRVEREVRLVDGRHCETYMDTTPAVHWTQDDLT